MQGEICPFAISMWERNSQTLSIVNEIMRVILRELDAAVSLGAGMMVGRNDENQSARKYENLDQIISDH